MLYYAIISYCLASCLSVEDMKRFIYEEPIGYFECIRVTSEMVIDVREHNPKTRSRPINTLCVAEDVLKDIEKYPVFRFGKPI